MGESKCCFFAADFASHPSNGDFRVSSLQAHSSSCLLLRQPRRCLKRRFSVLLMIGQSLRGWYRRMTAGMKAVVGDQAQETFAMRTLNGHDSSCGVLGFP